MTPEHGEPMGRVTPAPGSAAHRVQPVSGTPLDPWMHAYADRTHGMRASEIRALFAVANRPEVVSLAGGCRISPGSPSKPSPSRLTS